MSVVESRLHFPPLSHILNKPHLNQIISIITMNEMLIVTTMQEHKESSSDLVLYGHDRVVLGGVDVQDMVVVLPAQVVGDVGEGGAGRLGHAVVDDDKVVFAL